MKNKADWQTAYSVFFLIMVFSIFIVQLFVSDMTVESIPERYLWKETLIEKYRKFKYDIGDNVFSSALVGKEGWLFFTGEMSLRNYQKNEPLSVSNIKKLVIIFNQLDAAVKEYGGTFLVVVPPDKSTIYPQYMPDEIPVIGQTTSLDRLIERVEKYSDVRLVDLRPVLLQASNSSQVYYKTDTHWNCFGAYYTYQETLSAVSEDYPNIKTYTMDDFDILSYESSDFDIAKMMGAKAVDSVSSFIPRFETKISLDKDYGSHYDIKSLRVLKNLTNSDQPDLLIFYDSFYDACLYNFVEPTFGRTISARYLDIELAAMLDIIQKERPKVVVLEFVERLTEALLQHLYE